MTHTYFNHPLEDRHTWFSGDKTTKKVLDYVIVDPFVQQYVIDCTVDSEFDCDSDHRIIITSITNDQKGKMETKAAKNKKQQNGSKIAHKM